LKVPLSTVSVRTGARARMKVIEVRVGGGL